MRGAAVGGHRSAWRGVACGVAWFAAAGCAREDGPEAVTLRVMNWATDLELDAEQRIADRFEASHPGVRVIVESIVANYGEKLISAIASGTPPDVFLLDNPDIPAFADRNLILDLSPYAPRVGYEVDSLFEPVRDVFSRGGRLFAFPKGFSPFVIYYNRRVFRDLGVPPPPDSGWTWDDFERAARALTRDTDGDGRTDLYAINFPRRLYEWIPFVWSAGADVLDPQGRRTAGYLDSDATVSALAFLTSWATDWGIVPPLDFRDEGDPMRVGRFYVGRQAMLASGHWHVPRLRSYARDGAIELGVTRVPRRPGVEYQTPIYASGWAVPVNVRHKRLAVALAAFLGGPDAQRERGRSGLEIPALRPVARDVAAEDPLGIEEDFLAQIPFGRPPWGATVADFHEIERMSLEIMDGHVLNGTPLDSLATLVSRRIDEVIAR